MNTLKDILEKEHLLASDAVDKYEDDLNNVMGFHRLLNTCIDSAGADANIFMIFMNQVKKFHLLAVISFFRQHRVQGLLNLRQVLEAGALAAFALENTELNSFVKKNCDGYVDVPKKLRSKVYKWLEENYLDKSNFILNMKGTINNLPAHANIIYAMQNFAFTNGQYRYDFFDGEDAYLIMGDLWTAGNIALGLMDLFYGVNLKTKNLVFSKKFVKELEELEIRNHNIKGKLFKSQRFKNIKL